MELPHVPILGYKTLNQLAPNLDGLLKLAEGVGFRGQNREGILLKSLNNEVAVKVISNTWLLKKKE